MQVKKKVIKRVGLQVKQLMGDTNEKLVQGDMLILGKGADKKEA